MRKGGLLTLIERRKVGWLLKGTGRASEGFLSPSVHSEKPEYEGLAGTKDSRDKMDNSWRKTDKSQGMQVIGTKMVKKRD